MYMTSREFNQDLGRAKRESLHAPVIVTDRGTPKHVLLSFEEYEALNKQSSQPVSKPKTLFDWFAEGDPEVADIELEIPPRSKAQRPPVDFGEM